MTAIDTNILVELLVNSHPDHLSSSKDLDALEDDLGLTSVNIAESLRLLTHPKVFSPCLKMREAVALLEEFIDANQISLLAESKNWWLNVGEIAQTEFPEMRGNDIFDAQIASCLQYNGIKRIWTRDSDFRKFSFLQVIRSFSTTS